jgi:hypothetical protein
MNISISKTDERSEIEKLEYFINVSNNMAIKLSENVL